MMELIRDVVGVAFFLGIIILPLVDGHQVKAEFDNWIYIH